MRPTRRAGAKRQCRDLLVRAAILVAPSALADVRRHDRGVQHRHQRGLGHPRAVRGRARVPLRLSEQAFGLVLATVAAGSLFGSFVAEPITRILGRARALALTILLTALLVGVPAVTTSPVFIGAVFFLGGTGVVIWNVIVVSLRQRITPHRLLGRVNSAYRLLAWG
jgi:MFS family permease